MTTTSAIEFSAVAATGSGWVALWDAASFAHMTDQAIWEEELIEPDEAGHLAEGHLVPLNILCDGRFGVHVRFSAAAAPELNEREAAYREMESEPYLFRSNGTVHVTGVEYIGKYADEEPPQAFTLPAGEYAATVHMLDWEKEPGMLLDDGKAATDALPDFVVLVGPITDQEFRCDEVTFDDI
ncbi:hypothetical protein ATK86_0485 [Nocardia fluminea]|uniref:Uncharacterized protein n=2 Tax=Nocardia fluminea TaxID=134984 RepID=A0A2N3WX66_9NOCA|nr:hypothetical protein ATK86_0485 [Nocardia fluminea]